MAFATAGWVTFSGGIEVGFTVAELLGLAFPPGDLVIVGIHATLDGGLIVGIGATAYNCAG